MRLILSVILAVGALSVAARPTAQQPESFDTIIRGGTVFDGSGSPGVRADVGIRGDRIAAVRDLSAAKAGTVVDATGLAVAPGLHQHAVVVDRVAAGRRPLAGRDPSGCDHADLRRRQLDGPAQRGDEEADGRADGRPQVRHHLDDAGRVSGGAASGEGCRRTSRRFSGRPRCASTSSVSRIASRRAAELDAMRDARAAGDGGGGARDRVVA